MKTEHKIRITGEYDLLVLSPAIITCLLKQVKLSDAGKFVISAKAIFPPGYADYLKHVITANLNMPCTNHDMKKICQMIVQQVSDLTVDQQKCFEKVSFNKRRSLVQFHLNASRTLYLLVMQKNSIFTYVYRDMEQKEVELVLLINRRTG